MLTGKARENLLGIGCRSWEIAVKRFTFTSGTYTGVWCRAWSRILIYPRLVLRDKRKQVTDRVITQRERASASERDRPTQRQKGGRKDSQTEMEREMSENLCERLENKGKLDHGAREIQRMSSVGYILKSFNPSHKSTINN